MDLVVLVAACGVFVGVADSFTAVATGGEGTGVVAVGISGAGPGCVTTSLCKAQYMRCKSGLLSPFALRGEGLLSMLRLKLGSKLA